MLLSREFNGQFMDLFGNDDMPNPVQHAAKIRLLGRSASRLSPEFLGSEPKFAEPAARGVRRKASQRNWCLTPITRCAERPTSLILQAPLVRDLCKPQRWLPRVL
jgi:hypothetical protein